ncbi:hypothetical protein Q9Q60_04045 [Campylobacter upsaliensis]|uniref:hypothetical protein n=1 Tax=Campylobacter upsaliensis TaxID=28080 RepID=UPI0022EB5D36|nr:hypothetical protein [Campylobacter upsaliensis]MEB2807092.1 hypothetical protein [Campylobacter upsaliensis]MEB2818719.1 hypothetical protein [Campylobacter upsaliensis]
MREELLKPLLDKLGFVNMGLSGVRDTTEKIAIKYDNNKWALSDGLFEPKDLI